MKLKEVMDFVDAVKPNTFSNAEKTVWINEVEGMVQTDIMLISENIKAYVYSKEVSADGIYFPDSATMVLPEQADFIAGEAITISGLETYAANNTSAGIEILSVSEDGKELSFAEGTFTDTGEEGDSGTATVSFDGSGAELLVAPPFDKLYRAYLAAQIDFWQGEYDKYNNTMQLFNSQYAEYTGWYADRYAPADI